jgi:uncharacterized membrane protein (DUF485 family)
MGAPGAAVACAVRPSVPTVTAITHPKQRGDPVTTAESPATTVASRTAYEQVQATPEFQGLKRTLRRFVFPATAAFLAWYLLYVLMSAYARDVMGIQVLGNINVAYLFGLLQFVSTFAIAYVYARYADKHFDPVADRIRAQVEEVEQ